MCKVYTGYHGTSEIEHGLCACTVDNPLAKAKGLSLRTGAQTMLCLSLSTYGPAEFANSLDQRSWHKMCHLYWSYTVCRTEQNFIDLKLRSHTGGVRAQRSIQKVIYRLAELNNTRNDTSNVMNT